MNPLQQEVFVGRQKEMAQLRAALDDVLAGLSHVVMMVGEPGIGKSRTAQELASIAEQEHVVALWGHCYEGEGSPPYWPWIQLIRDYVRGKEVEQIRKEMDVPASIIAEIVPEINRFFPDLKPPPTMDPQQARFRLFDSVTTFLKNASQSQPLLIILEDLHWADASTLLLLEFIAREVSQYPIMIIGTFRDVEVSRRHPLTETVSKLIRQQNFLRIELPGLSESEVGNLLELGSGIQPSPDVIESVHARTEGNPLFVGQIAQLVANDPSRVDSWQDATPQAIRDVIGERLNRLSSECNRVLTMASVIGREFEFDLLEHVADVSDDQLLDLLDEALEGRIIEDLHEAAERYQFAHALIQETLYQELSSSRRVRLHARIADALEKYYTDSLQAHVSEIAHHLIQSERLADSEKLLRYSIMAGEHALAAYAWTEALEYFERALALKQNRPMDDETADIYFGLCRAQSSTQDSKLSHEASDSLKKAFNHYAEVGNILKVVESAEFNIHGAPGEFPERVGFVERALEMVAPGSYEEGRLLCRYGYLLEFVLGDSKRATEALERSLAIAREHDDEYLEMRVLVTSIRSQESSLSAIDMCIRGSEIARKLGDLFHQCRALNSLIPDLLELGRIGEAQQYANLLLSLSERMGDQEQLGGALHMGSISYGSRGEWQRALEYSNRALELAPLQDRILSSRILMEYQLGNSVEGDKYLERLMGTPYSPVGPGAFKPFVVGTSARISDVSYHFEAALVAGESVLSSPRNMPNHVINARIGMGLIAIWQGDIDTVQEQYARLQDERKTFRTIGISVDRVLGIFAQAMGEAIKAKTHFEEGLNFCREAGFRPELAWTCYDYVSLLMDTAHQAATTNGQQTALALIDEALSISTELGMRPLVEKVTALKEQAESIPQRTAAYPGGLTEREVEVLRLIASGKTDREIADLLFISIRTVGNHVHNILNKTTTSNRTEATAYAARNGLI